MKKTELGRSMVEMLGVLAVIGVLSIGGLAGYTMSMRRHHVNEVKNYISLCNASVGTAQQNEVFESDMDCYTLLDNQQLPAGILTAYPIGDVIHPEIVVVWIADNKIEKKIFDESLEKQTDNPRVITTTDTTVSDLKEQEGGNFADVEKEQFSTVAFYLPS